MALKVLCEIFLVKVMPHTSCYSFCNSCVVTCGVTVVTRKRSRAPVAG